MVGPKKGCLFLEIGYIFSNWIYFEKFSFYGNFFDIFCIFKIL